MIAGHLPPFYRLTPVQIAEVEADLSFIAGGGAIYYAVDSTEIIDYCFPVEPFATKRPNIDRIADDQAALHELFGERLQTVVLPPPYQSEISRHKSYLATEASAAFTEAEILGTFMSDLDLDEYRGRTRDDILGSSERNFNVLLALVLGIFNIGVERFQRLETRLSDSLNRLPEKVRQPAESYRPSALVDKIVSELTRRIHQSMPAESRRRMVRSAEIDAQAVDWILFMNDTLQKLHQAGKLDRRYLFLYGSSAPRNNVIFNMPAVRDALPVIGDRKHSIWRERDHIFTVGVCT